jgi:putative transposase
VGLQVSHCVHTEATKEESVWRILRRQLVEIFHELALHKESKIVERHMMGDHVHMCLSIPPKYAVSNVVGYLKGKSAIQIARRFGGRQKNFTGEPIWARGYFVSTVGLDENIV